MDIWSLNRQGFSNREIARKLGIDRRTVKKYLANPEFPRYLTNNRASELSPFHDLIRAWLKDDDFSATKIHEKILVEGFQGSYETVKRFVRTIKEDRDRIAFVRFESEPGAQAQMDFGEFKIISPDGTESKIYLFLLVLGYSRHMYGEFIEECTMTRFLDCHKNAFGFLHGVPGVVLYDNMKNVVLRNNKSGTIFNETFLDFARHYGFQPKVCPPYSPWAKGKVERPINFVRERFWRGFHFQSLEQANGALQDWLRNVAFERIHGTTREVVKTRYERERFALGEIPRRSFDTSEKVYRKVYKDCLVSFAGNRFAVPHQFVGKKVLLKIKNGVMRVFNDDKKLVTYRLPTGKGNLVAHPWVYENLRKDQDQLSRKYGRRKREKGKATKGILKHGLRFEVVVEKRMLSVYDEVLTATAGVANG